MPKSVYHLSNGPKTPLVTNFIKESIKAYLNMNKASVKYQHFACIGGTLLLFEKLRLTQRIISSSDSDHFKLPNMTIAITIYNL